MDKIDFIYGISRVTIIEPCGTHIFVTEHLAKYQYAVCVERYGVCAKEYTKGYTHFFVFEKTS